MSLRSLVAATGVLALCLTGCAAGGGGRAIVPAAPHVDGTSTATPTELTAADFADRVLTAARAARSVTVTKAMTYRTGGEGTVITRAVYRDDAVDLDVRTLGVDGAVVGEVRLVDGALYSRSGGTGRFLRLDDAAAESFGAADPFATIALFEGAIVAVEPTGASTEADGVPVRGYRVVLDRDALAGNLPASEDWHLDQLPELVVYEYGIGPDDLIRWVRADLASVAFEATVDGWGAGPTITAPTADEPA